MVGVPVFCIGKRSVLAEFQSCRRRNLALACDVDMHGRKFLVKDFVVKWKECK